MSADIYIVSGFLGAGKTTLIQKLLREDFKGKKVALIENDFGEISVDAALLANSGVSVKEINSGCICCTLYGDFVTAVGALIKECDPDTIIIEPSGVGKLSDIEGACAELKGPRIAWKMTVADVKRCKMYLENFGEFYEDQIKRADVVVLSRVDESSKSVPQAIAAIRRINPDAPIIDKDWGKVSSAEILGKSHGHDEHHHHHHHGLSADEAFDTATIRTGRAFGIEELKNMFSKLEEENLGVLRAKGIVRGENGFLNVQYLPGELEVTKCESSGDALVFIGSKLDRSSIVRVFKGV
jgi:G3E family GTPase